MRVAAALPMPRGLQSPGAPCSLLSAFTEIPMVTNPASESGLQAMARRSHLTIFIVTILHLALTQVLSVVAMVMPVEALKTVLVTLARLPLTPLAVNPAFWDAQHKYEAAKGLVSISNSLVFAVLVILCIKFAAARHTIVKPG